MPRCIKLSNNFYSMDLITGKTTLTPTRNFHCFFIVEHTYDKAFVREQALQLLMSQCKNFEFYGTYSRDWELGFDEVDVMLHPGDDEDIALTSAWNNFDAFVESLEVALSSRTFIPSDIYLIYDDDAVYKAVLQKVL